MVIIDTPFAILLAIILNELQVPANVFLFNIHKYDENLTNDPTPSKTPTPASNGPFTSPACGFLIKSPTPELILVHSPTGFPLIINT
jgi:hypothetical protein